MRYLLLVTIASWLFLPAAIAEAPAAQKEESIPKEESVTIDREATEPSKVLTIETTGSQVKVSNESHTLIAAMIGAYKNNPDLQQKRHAVLATHEQYVQATAGWRPNVTLGGSITGNARNVSGNTKDGDAGSVPGSSGSSANTREGNLQLTQNLYNGGATTADISKADQSARSAWAGLQSAEQNVLFSAVKAFLDLLSQYSQVELYKANKVALQKSYEAAVEKRNIGEETQTQVANAEAKLADAEAQLLTAEAQLEGLKATYTQITGLQPAAQMQKPEPFLSLLPADLKNAVQLAKDQHPDVIAAQFDHLVAQSETQRIGGSLLPSVNVSATSSRNESRSHASYLSSDHDYRSKDYYTDNRVMLEVKVPLYEGGSVRSQKRQAHETAVSKRVAIETARTQVIQAAIQAWQNFQAAKNNIENYLKQVKASQVSLEGTQQEMMVGTKILLDVLNAQAALLEAQLKLVQAEQAYALESFRLMAAVGLLNARHLKLQVDYFSPETHYQITSGKF
ncbi:MAG: TolC family outer membrane protein [Alphaproteobacteria bacterium]|nr:TolC family outer membrane protein [Alphaproteobacteria bacterium]